MRSFFIKNRIEVGGSEEKTRIIDLLKCSSKYRRGRKDAE